MVSSARPPAYTMRQLFVFVAVAETILGAIVVLIAHLIPKRKKDTTAH